MRAAHLAKPAIVLSGSAAAASGLAWKVGFSPIAAAVIAAFVFVALVGGDLVIARLAPEQPRLGYAAVLKGSALDGLKVLLAGLGCSIPVLLLFLVVSYLFSEFGR